MRRSLAVSICLFLCSLAAAATDPPAGTVIPLEQFTRYDEFGEIKISPDGEFIALATGKYGRSALLFISLKDMKVVSGVRTVGEHMEIDEFHWASPTRLIYLIAERQPGLARPTPTGEIFAIDRDGRKGKQLYGYRAGQMSTGTRLSVREDAFATPKLISTLRDDDKHILIAEHRWRNVGGYWRYDPDAKPQIARLDIYSGQKKSLGAAPLNDADVLADRDEQVRFALGWNAEAKLAVVWKPSPADNWQAFDLPGFREESVIPRQFSADNQSILFTGVREGETYSALYRLDLKTQAMQKLHEFEEAEIDDLITDFAGREIVGVRGYKDRPVYHWLREDDPAAKLYMALQRAFPGQSVHITSASQDGRLAVVFVSSDVNPGDYYLFDVAARKASYLRSARTWIDPRQMRPKEPIEVAARDGLKLHGYLTRPAGDGPYPLIVLPHGGPHGVRDAWYFDSEAQLLANRGYAVLQLNYRGSGGYGMDFQLAGHREWGGRMQDDLTDATHWAVEQKIAQSDRICIYGVSYGGYAALMGAVREPKLYRCAIGVAGAYDLELMLSSADIPLSRTGRAYLDAVLGDDSAELRTRSPAYNAQRIEAPVLLIHGKEDGRVDYEHAKRMKAALEKHGKPLEWMALSREGHSVYDEQTQREVYERILTFLDKHLMNAGAAAAQ